MSEATLHDILHKFEGYPTLKLQKICDHCCNNLLRKTRFAYKKVVEWSLREEEFVKQAAFRLIATLAIHDKKAGNERFEELLIVMREVSDGRKYVKKAVNWALRQIGKRNLYLNKRVFKADNPKLKTRRTF